MSLVVAVDVNRVGTDLGLVTIQRTATGPDGINTYRYDVYGAAESDAHPVIATGEVRHQYADGALRLLRKALEAADV